MPKTPSRRPSATATLLIGKVLEGGGGGGKGSSWVLGAVTKNSFFHIICRSHFHIICRSILGWINQHKISSSKQTCHSINSWCAKGSWSRSRLLGVIFVVFRGGGFLQLPKFILKMLVEVDFWEVLRMWLQPKRWHRGSSWTRTCWRNGGISADSWCPTWSDSQDAKSKLREIAEKRAEDVEEVMVHLEKTLAYLAEI